MTFPLLVSLFFIACATTTKFEPDEKTSSIAVGNIQLEAKNFQYFGNASVNGTHLSGIDITIKNLSNGTVQKNISSMNNGLFYFPVENNNRYQITRLYLKVGDGSGSFADILAIPGNAIFDIGEGKVFTLDKIRWIADKKENSYAKIIYEESRDLKEIFSKSFMKSAWSQYVWEKVIWMKY